MELGIDKWGRDSATHISTDGGRIYGSPDVEIVLESRRFRKKEFLAAREIRLALGTV